MVIRILLAPFTALWHGLLRLLRWMTGGLYDLATKHQEEIPFADLLEGDFTGYEPEDVMEAVDCMDGYQFEAFSALLLCRCGFDQAEITKGSGDQGVDILARKEDITYAFQCKNVTSKLGNTPIQEVTAGRAFYRCHIGIVLTNSFFTEGAEELAGANLVLLWDRDRLRSMVEKAMLADFKN